MREPAPLIVRGRGQGKPLSTYVKLTLLTPT